MIGLETLLTLVLTYGGGYLHRWVTEPEVICREIVIEVPNMYTHTYQFGICKEDKENQCLLPNTSYEYWYKLREEDFNEYGMYIQTTREYLKACLKVINDYNNDKFYLK